MVIGGLVTICIAVPALVRTGSPTPSLVQEPRNLGRAILLGLEFLIVGNIVRTVVVEPTPEAVVMLGAIDGRWHSTSSALPVHVRDL